MIWRNSHEHAKSHILSFLSARILSKSRWIRWMFLGAPGVFFKEIWTGIHYIRCQYLYIYIMNIDIIYITSEMNVAIFQGISLCQRWKKIGSRDISWLRFRLTVLLDPVPEKRQAVWQDSLLQMSGWWMVMSLTSSSEYWGNMTDDKVVLKKFPTSSISIWGRLPCWLMFFGLKPAGLMYYF